MIPSTERAGLARSADDAVIRLALLVGGAALALVALGVAEASRTVAVEVLAAVVARDHVREGRAVVGDALVPRVVEDAGLASVHVGVVALEAEADGSVDGEVGRELRLVGRGLALV